MQHRIRIITWLLAVCVLGINGFQAYWLYSTYKLTLTQFDRTAHETLVLAVQQYLTQVVEQNKAQAAMTFSIKGRSSRPVGPRSLIYGADVTMLAKNMPRKAALYMSHNLRTITIDDWSSGTHVKLARLKHLYALQLHQHGLDSAAVLDTFALAPAKEVPAHRGQQATLAAGFTQATPAVLLSPNHGVYVLLLRRAAPAPVGFGCVLTGPYQAKPVGPLAPAASPQPAVAPPQMPAPAPSAAMPLAW